MSHLYNPWYKFDYYAYKMESAKEYIESNREKTKILLQRIDYPLWLGKSYFSLYRLNIK